MNTEKTALEIEHARWQALHAAFKATGTKKLTVKSVCSAIGMSYTHGARLSKNGIPVFTMRRMNDEAAKQLAAHHSEQAGISVEQAAKSLQILEETVKNIQSLIKNS